VQQNKTNRCRILYGYTGPDVCNKCSRTLIRHHSKGHTRTDASVHGSCTAANRCGICTGITTYIPERYRARLQPRPLAPASAPRRKAWYAAQAQSPGAPREARPTPTKQEEQPTPPAAASVPPQPPPPPPTESDAAAAAGWGLHPLQTQLLQGQEGAKLPAKKKRARTVLRGPGKPKRAKVATLAHVFAAVVATAMAMISWRLFTWSATGAKRAQGSGTPRLHEPMRWAPRSSAGRAAIAHFVHCRVGCHSQLPPINPHGCHPSDSP
jgi:hypothetical protein